MNKNLITCSSFPSQHRTAENVLFLKEFEIQKALQNKHIQQKKLVGEEKRHIYTEIDVTSTEENTSKELK
jgi:hypothetical protein